MTDPKRELAIQAAEAIDPTFAGHAMDVANELDPTIATKGSNNRIRAQALIDSYKHGMDANAPRNATELAELTSLLLNNGD